MSDFNTLLEHEAPAPLAPLRDIIISPANIAAEARRKRAATLTWTQRFQINRQLKAIAQQVRERQPEYERLKKEKEELRLDLTLIYQQKQFITEDLEAEPDNPIYRQQLENVYVLAEPRISQYKVISAKVDELQKLIDERDRLQRALEDHALALQRQRDEDRLFKALREEAKAYETLIISRWNRLGFCHRYTKGNTTHTDSVRFSEVSITLDAIYFKLDTSYKTALGGWDTAIPEGVSVLGQLLDPKTLDELSVVCQRQVTGVNNHNGSWVVVNRLNTSDGLLNKVLYRDVMTRYPGEYHRTMPICVGVTYNRRLEWVNLSQFAHWLVGGITGSGKSNMINVGLCTLISQQSPQDLRVCLIDLKGGVEFDFYSDIPHLHGEIVSTVQGVIGLLSQLEAVMNERAEQFRGVAKNIDNYRLKRPDEYMPRILCIFDEVASIMEHSELTKRIVSSLRELTRKGRFVGIHIWLATQRPDVKALPGEIKANLQVRISGRLPTSADSVTILGNSHAKDLASNPGRMVLEYGPEPVMVQTPYITDDDVAAALKQAKHFPAPPPLPVPETIVIDQQWTPEKIAALSIKYLEGNIAVDRVYKEVQEDLSRAKTRELVEAVWNMEQVEIDGQAYAVKRGKGKVRTLTKVS